MTWTCTRYGTGSPQEGNKKVEGRKSRRPRPENVKKGRRRRIRRTKKRRRR